MKKFLALILAAVMSVAAFSGCSKKESKTTDLEYIKNKKTLVVAITEYKPMNYYENDVLVGFDTEFTNAVADKLGVKAEFKVINWDRRYTELDSKSVDCIWNGMTISDEVRKNADISNPYVKNAQVVVAKKDKAESYKSLDDMKDVTFAVESTSAGQSALTDNGVDASKIVEVTAQSDALTEVKTGSSGACVIDLTMANSMIGEGTSFDNLASCFNLSEEEYGIAFRKGSDVTAQVNKIMAELMSDGTLDSLASKYNVTLVK